MTLYGASDPQVIGQPISPFFGQQQNVRYTGAPVIPSPNASPNSGPQVTLLASVSNGSLPRNALVTTVEGVNAASTPVDDLMSNGAGPQVNEGAAIPGANGNPSGNGAINQQIFVDGIFTANAALSTGPVPTDIETLTSCPVSGATVVSNVVTSGFQG